MLLEVLDEMLTDGWSDQLMGRMVEMDDRMDAKGYLRLTTYAQTMRLLGNAWMKGRFPGSAGRHPGASRRQRKSRSGCWQKRLPTGGYATAFRA